MQATPTPYEERVATFTYRGWFFLCRAERLDESQTYRPIVRCRVRKGEKEEEIELPNDTDEIAYATEAEALRHAEQQAMRWVHDRSGDGQGQF
ncbi:hypothetical protein [Variovorax sp. W2I14]|uniref:hypothetical protein n=1 Tax=Variovorax sp. W2I14 TaxID=3042290 RepID=UPI003D1BCDD9